MVPRALWSLRMCVYEFMAAAQQPSQMVGRFSPNSSCGACRPALGKPLVSVHILQHVASRLESIVVIDVGESAIRQCVCMILELAPYKRRHCFTPGGRGVVRTALLIVDKVSIVHLRCAFGLREAVRAVPRYSSGSGSSCNIIEMGVWPTRILAKWAWSAESGSFFRFRFCSSYM